MADAESNLVPSEAADQVEVALETQAAADDGDGFRIANHGQNLFQRLFLCNNHKM